MIVEANGGKADSLARLAAIDGIRVPPWFVIGHGAPLDDVDARLARLGAGKVAVRSSGEGEDGELHSFAGIHDTFLDVDAAGLRDAIARCRASVSSERAVAYRAARGLGDAPRLAVIVQRMIDAEVSGVVFTADPSSGDRTNLTIAATRGLGDALVSGAVAGDSYTVSRAGVTLTRDGDTLDDARLAALARAAIAIESAYGRPVDLEFAFDATGLWLLQARPITTARVDPHAGRRRLWDNSNIIESYHGVTTPLTYSFARRAYGMVYRQAFALLGVPRRELTRHAALFEQMIGLCGGRVYYNLESWYRVLQLLPGYKFNAAFMEQMMGVSEGASFGRAPAPRTAAQRWLVDLPELVASLGVLATRFARAGALTARFFDDFAANHADFWDRDLDALSFDELIDVYLDAEERIMGRWQAPIVNDLLAMIFFGALRKALASWGLEGLHNDLLCGEGGLESTEPTRDLLALADELRAAGVTTITKETAPGWLKTRVAQHVDRFGDRCIDELKLEQPTLRDDDRFVYDTLRAYLAAPPVTVAEMDARERAIRADAEARVHAALSRPRRPLFRYLLAGARRHVKQRENLRFARTRAFGLVRRVVVAAGRRLAEAGRLDDGGDVFFLEIGELIAFARGTATTTDLRGLVAVRKAEHARQVDAPAPPERFWTRGAAYLDLPEPPAPARASDGAVLRGVAAAPGKVRAPARCVIDPRGVDLGGAVLVAARTDPGWVPLFPSARAVVVERGSVLSHSAIVAREFGIPCVVGLRGALAAIRDGAMIEVDGSAGTVTLI